jgi:cytochrome c oxidase assembly protein subunit 15
MRLRLAVTPQRYAWIAYAALALLTFIVFTGAAVRLTGSGLGCPTWPKCTDTSLGAPLRSHQGIEFGNRLLTGVVGLPCILAFVGARLRAVPAGLLPARLRALPQRPRAGRARRDHGAHGPEPVDGHGPLPAVDGGARDRRGARLARVPRAARGGGAHRAPGPPRARDPRAHRLRRGGHRGRDASSAAGPHAGGEGTGDEVVRLNFRGADTLDFLITGHARLAAVFGVLTVAAWLWARRTGASRLVAPLGATAVLLGVQGVVGNVQYHLELPAELVWIHVALAAVTWNVMVWAYLSAGRPGRADTGAPVAPERPRATAAV